MSDELTKRRSEPFLQYVREWCAREGVIVTGKANMADDLLRDVRRHRRDMREARQKEAAASAGATGCICPPASERTCKNPKCPRQDNRSLGQKIRDGGGVFNG